MRGQTTKVDREFHVIENGAGAEVNAGLAAMIAEALAIRNEIRQFVSGCPLGHQGHWQRSS